MTDTRPWTVANIRKLQALLETDKARDSIRRRTQEDFVMWSGGDSAVSWLLREYDNHHHGLSLAQEAMDLAAEAMTVEHFPRYSPSPLSKDLTVDLQDRSLRSYGAQRPDAIPLKSFSPLEDIAGRYLELADSAEKIQIQVAMKVNNLVGYSGAEKIQTSGSTPPTGEFALARLQAAATRLRDTLNILQGDIERL